MNKLKKAFFHKFSWLKLARVFLAIFILDFQFSLAQVPTVDPGFDKGSILDVMINLIDWASAFLGLVSVIVLMYAGYLFMTAGGNEKRLQQAKGALKWAIVGIVVAMFAFGATTFVGILLNA